MDRKIEESICCMQAQLYAQHVVLRALARTHPDPPELLASWRSALSEAVSSNPVNPAHGRNSEFLADKVRSYSEEWTAELVEQAIPSPNALPV